NVIERMLVRAHAETIALEDVPPDIRAAQRAAGAPPFRERRRTIADDLYQRIIDERQSFWTTVYPLFMQREITRASVREVVRRGRARRPLSRETTPSAPKMCCRSCSGATKTCRSR